MSDAEEQVEVNYSDDEQGEGTDNMQHSRHSNEA